jgi:hypothetical protein
LVIDNFKAIEHLELDLRPFQVFVGPNDAGKSPSLFEERFERYLPHGDVARTMQLEVHGTCIDGNYEYRICWAAKPSPRLVLESLVVAGKSKFAYRGENADYSALAQQPREFSEIQADLSSFVARFDPRELATPSALGSRI